MTSRAVDPASDIDRLGKRSFRIPVCHIAHMRGVVSQLNP